MRQVVVGASLFAVLAGCGGQRMVGPSESTAPSSSGTSTLPRAQGVLCGVYGSAADEAKCTGAGTASTLAMITFRVPRNGTIQISAVTHPLGFEDYPIFKMACDGRQTRLTAVSGVSVPQPEWFKTVPGITAAMGAQDLNYAAEEPLAANSSCVLTISFDLMPEGLPYIPYDLTIRMQAP